MATRTVEEVLRSVADVLFPADEGTVQVDSRAPDGDTPLHVLAWRNDVEGARVLIQAGAPVNAVGDMGVTPLHVAVSQKNMPLVEVLLAAGADPTIKSDFGVTPAEQSERSGFAPASIFSRSSRRTLKHGGT